MTTLIEKARQTTGLQVSYLEFSNLGITVVASEGKAVLCVLFHDASDGEAFGRLVATEILAAFLRNYQHDLRTIGLNQHAFQDFQFELGAVIRSAAGRPVLGLLQRNRAVVLALLVREDARESAIVHATTEVDQFGVLANLKPLISAATDVMALQQDSANSVWLESTPTRASRLLVHKVIVGQFLIVQFSSRFNHAHYAGDVARASSLLQKVCLLGEMLKRSV